MAWWEVLVQQTINGLTRGAVFALIALGYTMVYGIIELINFAHGDVFMLGLFVSLSWFTLLGATKTLTGWQLVTILPLVFLLTMLTTAALNVAIDRAAYRPLRRSTRLAPLITAIGVSFMLENVALLWKGPAPIAYPDVFPSVDILREWFGVDSAIFVTTKRSEEHTSELQSRLHLVCRLLLEKKKKNTACFKHTTIWPATT